MAKTKKRTYLSPVRQEAAQLTRRKILAAAQKLFQDQGFKSTTLDAIAQAAAVSTPTVFALFQSKKGLLMALLDEALPQFEDLVRQGHKKTGRALFTFTARIARQMYDAERALFALIRDAAPEVEQEREGRRFLRQQKALTQFSPPVLDVIWMLTSRDVYRMLVLERKWSSEQYEKWLVDALTDLAKESTRPPLL